jgi:RNA polymerase sigma-70 factor, ECF subfamily
VCLRPNSPNWEDTLAIEHLGGLCSYAMILTYNPTEAEDLVEETYVRATPSLGRLRAGSNTKIWLFTILRNVWFNRLQRTRTRLALIETDQVLAAE